MRTRRCLNFLNLKMLSVLLLVFSAIGSGANGVEKAIILLPLDARDIEITGAWIEKSAASCLGSTSGCDGRSAGGVNLVVTVRFTSEQFIPGLDDLACAGPDLGATGDCTRNGVHLRTASVTISAELAARIAAGHEEPMALIVGQQLTRVPAVGPGNGPKLELVVDVQAN